jgi:hypothetical protein
MNFVYIKFNSRKDQTRGFYELATKAKVHSFVGGIYAVSLQSLKLLDDQHISYRRATDEEVAQAHGQVRNPVALVLQ